MVCTTVANPRAGAGRRVHKSVRASRSVTAAQLAGQPAHRLVGVAVLGDAGGGALAGVQDGRVVAAAEGAPDRGQRLRR